MTTFDDTMAALESAGYSLDAVDTAAAPDPGLAAVVDPYLTAAADQFVGAGAAVKSYQAALPMPLVTGLSVIGMNLPRASYPSIRNGICNVSHAVLEPTQGCPIPDGNPIDQAIASGQPFRVRLNFGRYSPAWAYRLAGSVQVTDAQDAVIALCPRWWDARYIAAVSAFVQRLAAKYDGLISSVFLASPMNIYAEPFMRQTGSSDTVNALRAVGYTVTADKASFDAMLVAFAAFKKTRLALSFNPYQYVTATTKGVDVGYTISLMDQFVTAFGRRAILQNNSIRTPALDGPYATMYAHMAELAKTGSPLSFQTATAPRIGSYADTLEWAVQQGAHLVEIQSGWTMSDTVLSTYDARLRANAGVDA